MSDAVSWARIYHSFLDNRKTADLNPDKVGHWLRIFLLASRNSPRGLIPDDKIVKRYLGASMAKNPDRLQALKQYFVKLGLIDKRSDGSLWVHNFSSRQWLANVTDNHNSTESSTESGYLCGNDKLIPVVDNNRVLTSEATQSLITETEKAFIGGLEAVIYTIKAIRRELSARLEALKPIAVSSNSNQPNNPDSIPDRVETPARALSSSANSTPMISTSARPISGVLPGCEGIAVRDVSEEHPITKALADKRLDSQQAITGILAHWQSLPGLVHHAVFGDDDRAAVRKALDKGLSVDQVKLAISRYSAFIEGGKAGTYRKAYRWTFYEFMTRHKGANLIRFNSPTWEETCVHFESNNRRDKSTTNRSVDSLLAKALQNP